MTNQPPITTKQADIIKLLYRHRFLSRTHIQQLMHHKVKARIVSWLKDLMDKGYIERIYDEKDFVGKTKPAVYYLGLNGIRYLRTLDTYPSEELTKRYRESKRQQPFIDRCLLLADCCLNVEAVGNEHMSFMYQLPADYLDPESDYHFLEDLQPTACFVKTNDGAVTNYLLEIFDATQPRYKIKKRVKDYVTFLDEEVWQGEMGDEEPPIVQLACATKADMIYAKRRATFEMAQLYEDDIPEELTLRFTTINQIRDQGFTSKIWEKLKVRTSD